MKFIGPTSNINLDKGKPLCYGLVCRCQTKDGIYPVTLWYNTEEERAARIEVMRAELEKS
jgi:hypothetical protein